MSIDLADYEEKTRPAVKSFWRSVKKTGTRKQIDDNMTGFIDLLEDTVRANGLNNADIIRKSKFAVLPGHFGPTQSWDLLVMNKGKLIAAIKFDAQVGTSIGKNADSCCDRAISLAVDFRGVYRRWAFGAYAKPFVGYLVLLEDAPASRKPVTDMSPNFPLFPEFRGASYADRYNILCKKLMSEELYTAAAVILSPRSAVKSGAYAEMCDETGLESFLMTLGGHITMEAPKSRRK